MKSVLLLLCFPCLMLLLTVAISYVERTYRLRLRRKDLPDNSLTDKPMPLSYVSVSRRNVSTLPKPTTERVNDLA